MQLGVIRIEKVYLRLTVTALAVLAMLIFAPPVNAADPTFSGGASTTRSVPENSGMGTNVGAEVTATDSDSGAVLVYSLTGTDSGSFTIVEASGQIKTKSGVTYNYEATKNSYTVTVNVHDGMGSPNTEIDDSIAVTINLTNVDEPGTVSISGTVSVGSTLTASVTDIDGTPTSVMWQWSQGPTAGGSFTNINPATSDSYTPVPFDVGKYLRARARYTDPQGSGKTARAETSGTVVSSNAEPMFSTSTTTRSVPENSASGIDIGAVVTATDSDMGDTLTYGLSGTDAGSFDIDSSNGQIKTRTGVTYDFEATKNSYSVTVTVRDSKDADGSANTATDASITVTINLTNAEEPGMVSFSGTLSGGSTLTASLTDPDGSISIQSHQWKRSGSAGGTFNDITSNGTSSTYVLVAADVNQYLKVMVSYTDGQSSGKSATSAARGPVGASNAEPMFSTDTTIRSVPENSVVVTNVGTVVTATDSNNDTLNYSLASSGDSSSFTINSASAQIKTKSGVTYDFEATKNSYTVTVNVRDSKDAAGDANTVTDDSITVTINLTNADDPGTVTFSGTLSGGSTLTASVTDPDGSISIPSYQWKRSGSAGGTFNDITSNGTSSTYVLVAADVNQYLKVTVSYTDGQSSGKSATSAARGPVGASNSEPMFSTETATRTLPENTGAGINVTGDTIAATDSNSDTLTYTLTGTDAGSFEIDSNGQLKTKTGVTHSFNFEATKKSYTVTVNVRDSKDAAGNANTMTDDNIAVTINLTNVDEPGTASISGTLSGGSTLTASVTDPDGSISIPSYQWKRSGSAGGTFNDITSNGTSSTYVLVAADVNQYLKVTVSYTDGQSSGKSATSAATGQIGASNAEPMFSTDTTTRSVPENSASGIDIGAAVTATDSDSSPTLFYSLNGSDAGSFTIDSASGQLLTSAALNYETKSSYTVTVNVRDSKDAAGDANTVTDDSITVTINLTNVDEPGTASISGTLSGGVTLTASVTDPDGSISIPSYQWKRSGSAGGTFNDITSNGTSSTYVLVAADVNQYLKVTVSYTDGQSSGKSATSAARGPVGASNSEPMFSTDTTTRSVPENTGAGINVTGDTIAATDSNSDTLTYTLTGTDAGSFEIDSNGQMKTKTGVTHSFNFEATKKSYTVTVNVRDSKDAAGNANTVTDDFIAVTINLTNVDEPGTASISGTLSGGETLTASVTDIDGTTTSVTWRWARGDTQNGSFTNITGATSDSYTMVAADVGKYLQARASYTDPQGSGKTANAVTSGAVAASNAEPMFSASTAMRTLPENSGAGVNVTGGTITATDSDGDGDTLTYTLTGTDAGSFEIDSSGQLKTKAGVIHNFNFEATKKSYTVTVNVRDSKDAASDANTVTDDFITVTINLTNVNEAPVIASPPATESIPENSTAVATFSATDVDASDTRTWSLEPADDGGKFTINPSSGVLTFTNAPDFETPNQTGSTANEYKVTVKVADTGGMSDTHTISVTVTNINEAPQITTDGDDYTVLKADENTATTEVIQTYEASDVDANSVLTWSLEGNDRLDFTITKNADGHGELRFANVPNFEMPADSDTNNIYEVTLKVRDNHTGQLSNTLMVELDLDDVNETPVVSGAAGPSFAEIEFDVLDADLSSTDYEIGAYTAFDEDEFASITWSVTGTDSTLFEIGPMTGVLSFDTRPDFENPADMADAMSRGASDNIYVIVVEADDGEGHPNSVGTFDVTVTVTQVNETPEITSNNATQTFAEIEYDATTANLEVDTFTGRDEETETITWSLGGTDMGDFSINSASGLLSFSQRPNLEMPADDGGDNVYDIIVKARDTTNNTRDYPVTVTVTDVNERPDIDEDTVPSYMEIEYDFTGTRPDVHTFSATDYDAGDTFTWSLLGTDAGDLDIDPMSGVLTFTQVPSLDVGPLPTFEAPQDDNADGSNTYNIIVRATDNHGKTEDYDVVVTVTDVNERPELTGSPVATVSYNENVTMDVAAYTARDEESAMNTWSLTGPDRGRFSISTEGVVTFDPNTFADGPNYEDPKDSGGDNVYNFTVVVTDTQSGSSRLTASIDVAVTVNDVEEDGTITVSNLNPAVGETVTFTLEDPDGGIVSARWLIQRRPTESDPWVQLGTARNDTSGSTSYIVDEDQTGRQVRAIVMFYEDRRGPDKEAESEPTAAITADPIVNAPPRFRSFGIPPIMEGPAGDVGERLRATDRDNDTLTFGIQEGDGSEYFAINPATGQTRTTQALDFESTSGFLELTVTLHDGRDDDGNPSTEVDDTKDFVIFVIDVEEPGVVTLPADKPEVETPLQATLADGDGNVSGSRWQWARSANGLTGWTNISGATSSSYTPKEEDGNFYLRASVTYTDRRGGRKSAEAVTSGPVPSENRRPLFPSTEDGQRTVAENTRAGVSIGDPVAAEDPENHTLVYTLVGVDAAAFTIVENTGQLRTSEALDFETKPSYSVTVEVHDGRDGSGNTSTDIDDSQSVTVTIENVEEPGVVTLTTDTATIQARVEVTAELIDGDGPSGIDWQWSRSPNGSTGWVNISNARSARYTPTLGEDAGNYIRATATYTDGHGSNSKTANAVSPRVGDPPPVNSAPAFPSTENGQREVAENTDGEIGDPLEATDFNNEMLYYSLSGTDAASFEIGQNNGQLRLASGVMLDFEGKRSYRFTVEVSDRADQNGDPDMVIDDRQNVTITVTNVNEAPVVTGDAAPSVEEDSNSAVASYTGTDPERDTLTWTVSGSGFWISDRGQLYFATPPSFELATTYTVIITATDDGNLSDEIIVNVTVTDVEEEGTVTVTPPRGWVDTQTQSQSTQFRATLTDGDGVTSSVDWQWARSSNRSGWTYIPTASSASYTATPADVGNYLRASVTYSDGRSSGKTASAVLAGRIGNVDDRPMENNDPAFADTTVTRSIGRGTAAGRSVGAPLRAVDEDTDEVLTYALQPGQDADKFDIDPATGQLRTKAVLDYDPEGQNEYTVVVEVHDGFNAAYSPSPSVDATIEVTITVTAVSRVITERDRGGGGGFGPALVAPQFIDGFRTSRPLAVTARAGDAVGDPVAATHPRNADVTYSLSGADAALFTVDEETGQIRLGQARTLALGQTYTINLTATDSSGTGAIIIVVIEVAEGVGDPYDLNRNGSIEKDEVLEAVSDYFADLIEKDEVLALVARYFAGDA